MISIKESRNVAYFILYKGKKTIKLYIAVKLTIEEVLMKR